MATQQNGTTAPAAKAAAPKAYSYIRFSTPDQAKGDSKRRQSGMAADYAKQHGLTLDTELSLEDLGVSAYRGKNLDGTAKLGAFLEAVKAGDVPRGSVLLVEALDRITRKSANRAAAVVQDIVDAGVDVVTLNDGKRYTRDSLNDGMDYLFLVILAMRAHDESKNKARRNKAAWVGKRESGKVMTALTPGWIRKTGDKLELIPEHAATVRRIFAMFVAGAGKQKIASTLSREQVPTFGNPREGRPRVWHQSYIRSILANRAVLGEFTPHIESTAEDGTVTRIAQDTRPDYYPRCIEDDLWTQAQAIGEAKAPAREHCAKPVVSILAGLARCPVCGGVMTRVFKGTKVQPVARLVCSAAKSRSAHAYTSVPLDRVAAALVRLAGVELPAADQITAEALRGAEGNLESVLDRIEHVVDAIADRPSPALSARLAALEAEADKVRANLAQLQQHALETDSLLVKRRAERLRAALSAVPLDAGRANAALRECLKSVVVDHENGELVLSWRHDGSTRIRYDYSKEFEDLSAKA
jgi:DNA invertase Pin-like site-specific DNA recombinase